MGREQPEGEGHTAVKIVRAVYDIAVDDKVDDEHIEFVAKEMAMNLRWGLVHDTDRYLQGWDGPDVNFRGVRRLADGVPAAAPGQAAKG